jgi:hypothetical protein
MSAEEIDSGVRLLVELRPTLKPPPLASRPFFAIIGAASRLGHEHEI